MTETVEYPYKANTRTMLFGIVFFGACAVALGRAAATNDRGLIINRVIELSAANATLFYATMAVLSLVFVAVAAWALKAGRAMPRFVRLTPTELSAPKHGFARQNTVVRMSDIRGMGVQVIQRQHLLTIDHAGGSITIPRSMLPDAAAFERLCSELGARLQQQQFQAGGAVR